MNAYFGEPWPSGICDEGEQVETPVGTPCASCGMEIVDGDRGDFMLHWGEGPVPRHRECSLRDVMGGIGHLTNHLHWCVEEQDPDAGLTRRESSVAVWSWIQDHGFPAHTD